jgi:hypothetical protein
MRLIVRSRSYPPSGIGPPGAAKLQLLVRFARWVGNSTITEEINFVPYAQVLLCQLALQTLVLIMDGSVVGRGCVALMLHVAYTGRALAQAYGDLGKTASFSKLSTRGGFFPFGALGVLLSLQMVMFAY